MSKITIDRSVLEQALEDMEMTINYVQSPTRREDMRDSIDALRAALEQEKSPQNASSALQASCEVPQVTDQTEHFLVLADEEVYCTKQPQVEQEPVAWIEHEWSGSGLRHLHFERPAPTVRDEVVRPVWTPLYLHPQPPRQPLTKEEISVIAAACGGLASDFVVSIASAIEVAHGIGGEK